MNKRALYFLVCCLGLSILAAACGSSGETGTTNDSKKSENVGKTGTDKGKVQTVNYFADVDNIKEYAKVVNPVLEKNFNLTLNPSNYSNTTSYQTALRLQLSTPDAPPIFRWWGGYRIKELADQGLLADMTSQWKDMVKDGLDPSLAPPQTVNGKIYGVPLKVNYWSVLYNKKLFDKHNLQPPKTWDEFIKLCRDLKQKGITPLGQSVNDGWPGFAYFQDLMIRYDPKLYEDLVIGKAKYTDPGVVEVFKIWKSLYDEGFFAPPVTWDKEFGPAFQQEKFAMAVFGLWKISDFDKQGMKAEEDYSAFVLPQIRPEAGKVIITEQAPILVSEKSKDKELAIKAAMALMSKSVQEVQAPSGVPVRTDAQLTNKTVIKLVNQVKEEHYTLINRFWEATPPELSEYASNQFVRFMLKPTDYMQVLNDIQKKADEYWSKNK